MTKNYARRIKGSAQRSLESHLTTLKKNEVGCYMESGSKHYMPLG